MIYGYSACPQGDTDVSQGRAQIQSGQGWIPPQPPDGCGLHPVTTGGLTYWLNDAQLALVNSRPWPGGITDDVFALGGSSGTGSSGSGGSIGGTDLKTLGILGVVAGAVLLLIVSMNRTKTHQSRSK